MNDDEYVKFLTKRCVEILIKYPKIFTISDIVKKYSKGYPKDKQLFILHVILETRIGLSAVVQEYFNKANAFRFIDSNANIENNIIVSVLNIYAISPLFRLDNIRWKKMLKSENLKM